MNSSIIFGIDEAGRGALCGPVAAACVRFYSGKFSFLSILQDSKLIPAPQREEIAILIKKEAFYGYGWAYPHEIDQLNIHNASLKAMQRAYFHCIRQLQQTCAGDIQNEEARRRKALVDGKFCPDLPVQTEAVVRGDSYIPEIQAASILAKVARDRIMQLHHEVYPVYSIHRHKGYPTAAHKAAIYYFGPSPIHRLSFKPCSESESKKNTYLACR